MVFALFFTTLSAHPSKEMKLDYNDNKLTVTLFHSTPFPGSHYIEAVTIKINGKIVNTYNYEKQPEKKSFTYTYSINASSGDKITVITKCNVYGKEEKTITVK